MTWGLVVVGAVEVVVMVVVAGVVVASFCGSKKLKSHCNWCAALFSAFLGLGGGALQLPLRYGTSTSPKSERSRIF